MSNFHFRTLEKAAFKYYVTLKGGGGGEKDRKSSFPNNNSQIGLASLK